MTLAFRPVGPLPEAELWRGALVRARDTLGRELLQLRDDLPHVAGAGCWSLFGGGVEAGETLEGAARREFAEETGIALAPGDLVPLARAGATAKPGGVLYVFDCTRALAPGAVRLGEGAGFGFLTPAQVDAWPLLPQIRALLQNQRDRAP
ncbi:MULTISPECIES: NUDIX domain-containing protein [unclassified Rhodosalinus]|uniref:NUDIX domain-containing protein n=1 Tax=unclassified Rhodosalinus TaxID=2630183 RepID=UPI003526AFDA